MKYDVEFKHVKFGKLSELLYIKNMIDSFATDVKVFFEGTDDYVDVRISCTPTVKKEFIEVAVRTLY